MFFCERFVKNHGWWTNHVSREINYPFHTSRKINGRFTFHSWWANHVSREINYPFHASRKNKTADSRFTKIPFTTLCGECTVCFELMGVKG